MFWWFPQHWQVKMHHTPRLMEAGTQRLDMTASRCHHLQPSIHRASSAVLMLGPGNGDLIPTLEASILFGDATHLGAKAHTCHVAVCSILEPEEWLLLS